jgi:short/branched chain acyl-CoA dehydrogenase
MGIETPADLSGSECSFTSAIIAVEELAKVDASVAVMVDVHNTLVNTVIRLYGSDAIKEKWLPGLATDTVSHSLDHRPAKC